MKILITNTTLCNFFGSQIFTYTLALELKKQGHDVSCFTSVLGQVSNRLVENGIPVYTDVAHVPEDIDIIHGQHRNESLLAFAGFPQKPMVLVCHGVLPLQEQPFRTGMNIRRYVAVSEEVRNHLTENHGIPADKISIVRNGVDQTRFFPRKPINPSLKNLLVLSNNSAAQQLNVIKQACEEKGINFLKIGFPAENVWNVEDYINEADLVVTLGRGVLEAAACKRLVVVYDYNGGDGLVTKETFPIFRQKSFSGRTNRTQYTVEQFKKVLDQYDPQIAEEVYRYIPEVDITNIAKNYVGIYEEAISDFKATEIPARTLRSDVSNAISDVIKDFQTEIDLLKKAARERGHELGDLTKKYLDKCDELHKREQENAQLKELSTNEQLRLQGDLHAKEMLLLQNEEDIAGVRGIVSQLESQLRLTEAELAERDEQIRQLQSGIASEKEVQSELGNKITVLEADLAQRDERIQQLAQEVVRADALRSELENNIALKEVDLAQRDERIRQLAQEVARADDLRSELEDKITLKKTGLAQRDERVRQLAEEVAGAQMIRTELEKKIMLKEVRLADLDERIRQIAEEVAQESCHVDEHIRLKEEALERQSLEVKDVTARLKETEEKISRIIAEKDANSRQFEQQLREKDQRIEDLLNSKSWKVTAPLRAMLDLFTK